MSFFSCALGVGRTVNALLTYIFRGVTSSYKGSVTGSLITVVTFIVVIIVNTNRVLISAPCARSGGSRF